MDKNNNYFYLSGFISLSLFILFLILFILLVTVPNNIQSFAMNKKNYISVSLDTSTLQQKTIKDITISTIKEQKTQTKSEDVDIDNLFSDVWTKNIKKQTTKTKKLDKRVLNQLRTKIKKSKDNEVESLSKKVQKIETTNSDKKNIKESSGLEVNEYLAKIQAIVYDNFYPPANSYGNSVGAVIVLSSLGKVQDFRILTYSSSTSLNSECDKIKARLVNIVFPINPDNQSGAYKITLTSKE